jgi:hypothetical protein
MIPAAYQTTRCHVPKHSNFQYTASNIFPTESTWVTYVRSHTCPIISCVSVCHMPLLRLSHVLMSVQWSSLILRGLAVNKRDGWTSVVLQGVLHPWLNSLVWPRHKNLLDRRQQPCLQINTLNSCTSWIRFLFILLSWILFKARKWHCYKKCELLDR